MVTKEDAESEAARRNALQERFRGCETKWSARKGRDGEWLLWYERLIPPEHPDHDNPYWGIT